MKENRIIAVLLVAVVLFTMTACGVDADTGAGAGKTESSVPETTEIKLEKKSVGESFVTKDFTFTVSDFQFVESVSMGDYYYDQEDVVTGNHSNDTIVVYIRFNVKNTGSSTYNITFNGPKLVSGDIVYDGVVNGFAQSHCITTDDASSSVSPLENKEFNYCIFNVPTAMMEQDSLEIHMTLGGVECVYTVK